MTRLELPADWLRVYLRREVERRLRAEAEVVEPRSEREALTCAECGGVYSLSVRNALEVRLGRVCALCRECRHPSVLEPVAAERAWVATASTPGSARLNT